MTAPSPETIALALTCGTLLVLLLAWPWISAAVAYLRDGEDGRWLRAHARHGQTVVRIVTPQEDHPPCCTSCDGTGAASDGPCWDCRATGHAHAGPRVHVYACPCGETRPW